MTPVSRLTIPALIGGLLVLAAAGLFSPQVKASWVHAETIAQVTGVPSEYVLNVLAAPDAAAGRIGSIARNAFVWVESCVGADSANRWCLVERGGAKGWVSADYLTPHRD